MSNIPRIHDDSYRAIGPIVAYARPGGEPMIQLIDGQAILARPAVEEGWLAWIEDGDVIGYLRRENVRREDASD